MMSLFPKPVVLALSLAVLSAVSCYPIPSRPPGWTFEVEYLESIDGMAGFAVGGRQLRGDWESDHVGAAGSQYAFVDDTNAYGYVYCIGCRYNATWDFYVDNGPCDDSSPVYNNLHVGEWGWVPIVCEYSASSNYSYDSPTDGYFPDDPIEAMTAYENSDNIPLVPEPGDDGTLEPGDRLFSTDLIESENGDYRLVYQSDGNLVLYDKNPWQAIWASDTAAATTGRADMQTDGNLVVYNASGQAVWSTGTSGNAGAYLAVLNNGTLMLFDDDGRPLWWSNSGS